MNIQVSFLVCFSWERQKRDTNWVFFFKFSRKTTTIYICMYGEWNKKIGVYTRREWRMKYPNKRKLFQQQIVCFRVDYLNACLLLPSFNNNKKLWTTTTTRYTLLIESSRKTFKVICVRRTTTKPAEWRKKPKPPLNNFFSVSEKQTRQKIFDSLRIVFFNSQFANQFFFLARVLSHTLGLLLWHELQTDFYSL